MVQTGKDPEGEDLSALEENENNLGINGKYRFDTLIKTMIARIEYNNTLAPVQEYGRHMQKVVKRKKKTDDQPDGPKKSKDVDERFYDLDDDFIDDDNLQEGAGWDGMMAGEAYMHDQNDEEESQQASSAMQYSAEADEAREAARE